MKVVATDGSSVKRLSSLAHYMVSRDPEEASEEDKVENFSCSGCCCNLLARSGCSASLAVVPLSFVSI